MRERRAWRGFVSGVTATLVVAGGLALLVLSVFGGWPRDVEGLKVLATVGAVFATVGVWFFLRTWRLTKLENAARQALPLEDGGFTSPLKAADLRRMHHWRTWVLRRPRLALTVRALAVVFLAAALALWLWRMQHERSDPLLSLAAWLLMTMGQIAASVTNPNQRPPPSAPAPRRPFSFP